MAAKAERLAESLGSKDHWAKPYYSDVYTLKTGVSRVFIGINSKGNKWSLKYDKKQQNNRKIWSGQKPFHNAYLDESWGDTRGGPDSGKGQSGLQIAVKQVFRAMYGSRWKKVLRNTPCFNLVPVSSNGTDDCKLDEIWDDGVKWGVKVIKHLRPKLIILYGNRRKPSNAKSVWRALERTLTLTETECPVHLSRTFKVYAGVIRHTSLRDTKVLGLPHLSMIKGRTLDDLCHELSDMAVSP